MDTPRAVVAVCADPADDVNLLKAAARVALDSHLPFLEKPKARSSEFDMLLVVTGRRLELRVLRGDAELRGGKPVAADFSLLDVKSGAGATLKQPIIRAMGVKAKKDFPVTVLDATAGWGEDAWLMAALGFNVLAVERSAVMATLLKDAVIRAATAKPEMFGRVAVVRADSRHMLRKMAEKGWEEPEAALPEGAGLGAFLRPDVVYLDPMFPSQRKSAQRKAMRVLRALVGDDGDADELLHWALRAAGRRVVVKRPPKAPALGAGRYQPTHAHEGKGVRYDVYGVKK